MTCFILWAGALYPNERTRRLEGGDWGGLPAGTFTDGVPIVTSPSTPMEIDLVPDEKGTAVMPPIFVVPTLVVRKDFSKALSRAGVDNIDYYSAILHDRARGQHWDDYLVGNVVGLVDAIDMGKSQLDPDSPPRRAMLFDTMVLDEQKCQGLLLFRLMHRQSLIVIAGSVAEHILAQKLPFIHIVKPEEFA